MSGGGVVDAHHHLWDTTALDYPLFRELTALDRPYRLADYRAAVAGTGVEASICVEAAAAGVDGEREGAWHARETEGDVLVRGLVAWAPLERPDLGARLDRLAVAQGARVVGVRRSFEFEPPDFAARPEVAEGARLAGERGLVVDLVLFPPALPAATVLVESCPGTRFVLDHLGKPPIRSGDLRAWREALAELALRPNVVAKLSGLPAEADRARWTRDDLAPAVEHALACFGPERLLYGSDWPVVELAGGHARWMEALRALIAHLPSGEREAIFAGNARRVYGLGA